MQYFLTIVILLLGLPAAAHASNVVPEYAVEQLAQARQQRLSLSEAAEMVQRRTGGRVLSAQASNEQGREVYRIKVLTGTGEVRVVLVDASTGGME